MGYVRFSHMGKNSGNFDQVYKKVLYGPFSLYEFPISSPCSINMDSFCGLKSEP